MGRRRLRGTTHINACQRSLNRAVTGASRRGLLDPRGRPLWRPCGFRPRRSEGIPPRPRPPDFHQSPARCAPGIEGMPRHCVHIPYYYTAFWGFVNARGRESTMILLFWVCKIVGLSPMQCMNYGIMDFVKYIHQGWDHDGQHEHRHTGSRGRGQDHTL